MYGVKTKKNVVVLVTVTLLDIKTKDVVGGRVLTLSSSIRTAMGKRGSFCAWSSILS